MKGLIVKGIGGFYYIESSDGIYECKARGNFRNKGISPNVGDIVDFSINENSENRIEKIYDRKNSLIRPPISNIDQIFIIVSSTDPVINDYIIDRMIAICEYKNIEPIIVFTKIDLSDDYKKYVDIYSKAGFKTITCNNFDSIDCSELLELLPNKLSVFTGNTGVGKSSLLNKLSPELELKTGETSKKLGRGKHTTRHSEIYKINNGYVVDTPGFSSIDIEKYETIQKDELFFCFREFQEYFGKCKFSTCSHRTEKGCSICNGVIDGKISKTRHDNYVRMYNEAALINTWEIK